MFNKMYDEPGKKLQTVAIVFLILGCITSLILGITILTIEDDAWPVSILVWILGPLCSFISSLFIYGFGSVIDLCQTISYKCSGMRQDISGIQLTLEQIRRGQTGEEAKEPTLPAKAPAAAPPQKPRPAAPVPQPENVIVPAPRPEKAVAPAPQPEKITIPVPVSSPVISSAPPKPEDTASVLAYALRFSTTSGMRGYLSSAVKKMSPEDQEAFKALLAVPDEQLPDAIRDHMDKK